jgi:hypothetical protein
MFYKVVLSILEFEMLKSEILALHCKKKLYSLQRLGLGTT